jgi:hypothetical protein
MEDSLFGVTGLSCEETVVLCYDSSLQWRPGHILTDHCMCDFPRIHSGDRSCLLIFILVPVER